MDKESYLTLVQAAELAPGRPSANAVWRWCRKGVKSRSGRRVKLNHIRVGVRIFTTEADLDRFFAELTAADAEHFDASTAVSHAPRTRGRTHAERARAIAAAERELEEAGI